ncbi:MAG: PspC domain-containing protein [Actinocrinis sp.]
MSEDESAGPGQTGRGAGAEPSPNPEQGPDSDTRPGAGGYTGGGYAGGGYGGPSGIGPALRELRRDRQSRMIAGVCGGLGRHLNIDPVVFRIMFAVLTFFGGFGLLLYAAAWLFVPDAGQSESEARKLVNGRGALAAVAVSLLVVIGFLAMTATLTHGFGHAVPLLVLATAIVVVMIWRGEGREQPPSRSANADGGWGPSPDAPERPRPWWQRPVPTSPAPGTAGGAGTAAGGAGPAGPGFTDPRFEGALPGNYGSTGSGSVSFGATSFGAADPSVAAGPGPMPMPPPYASPTQAPAGPSVAPSGASNTYGPDPYQRPSRPRRISGLALSAALLVIGVLGVLAQTGAIHVGSTAGLALTIMAVGAGLIIGGLFGRARALIPLGLVLALPLIAANAFGVPLRGQTGDTVWRPTSTAQLASPYDQLAGRARLDLTAIDPGGGTVHATAYVGVGRIVVTVPADIAITVTAHTGAGEIQFMDQSVHSGLDLTENFSSPAVGTSRGTIALDLKTGAGSMEVDRVGG